jgi:hypothetical protein
MKLPRPLLFLFVLAASGPLRAQGEAPANQRVFVCAHSFMIFTANLLPPMGQAAGIRHVAAGQQMLGGSRVIQHWNLPDSQNRAKAALLAGNVDVFTVSPHMLLPDGGIDNFTMLGLSKNPKLRVLVQASWPARDGVMDRPFRNEERNASTVESLRVMQAAHRTRWVDALETQVRALNTTVGHESVFIVPVSDAVFALRQRIAEGKAPGLLHQTDLFRDDLGHPQPTLAELVTYCHFAVIYGRSPEGLPVPAELRNLPQADALNGLLQKLAWEAVANYPMSGVHATVAPAAIGQ